MRAIVDETATADTAPDAAPPTRRRGILFWIRRYLPAEIVGTAVMLLAGLGVTVWTANPAAIALAALVGETVGFYAVLAVVIFLEVAPGSRSRRRALLRTGMLLLAEFGLAEVFDTFLVRPLALVAGVWLLADPLWGLLAGKLVADLIFYAIAAGAFTLSARWGLRGESGERAS